MSISKFDRRADTSLKSQMDRIKEHKEKELFHRQVGWVVFFVVIIALFIWLWHFFGAPPAD